MIEDTIAGATQEEIDIMAGKHGEPTAGKASDGKRGSKPKRTQVTVKNSSGTTLWGATVKLFGGKGKSK